MQIDQERLARVTTLKSGSHNPPNGHFEACVMEAAAYVAGEPWSDHPACACPIITAFMISWNDGLPNDEERARLLLPLIPKIVGTRGSADLQSRRATMAADWLVRVHTPAWLRLAGLNDEAAALANFPEITNFAKTPSIIAPLEASRQAAQKKWAAARDAAGAAAGAAARDAAWAAAGVAAWDAACAAARDAAGAAARDTARAAAWDAARAAARDALKPTRDELQASALSLVERMCALTDADIAA